MLDYARKHGLDVFIETGTYFGDMVKAVRPFFREVHSIELSCDLYEKAVKRFRPYPSISIYQGDSSDVLPVILKKIHSPCLFWLDGHYSEGITARGSKDTPVVEELSHILGRKTYNDVVLIDDAIFFKGSNGYPSLLEVSEQVLKQRPDFTVEVRGDIIRCHRR